jgi:hypothetical protein
MFDQSQDLNHSTHDTMLRHEIAAGLSGLRSPRNGNASSSPCKHLAVIVIVADR